MQDEDSITLHRHYKLPSYVDAEDIPQELDVTYKLPGSSTVTQVCTAVGWFLAGNGYGMDGLHIEAVEEDWDRRIADGPDDEFDADDDLGEELFPEVPDLGPDDDKKPEPLAGE